MKKAIISVIIPIYNTEKYLNRCIKSIVQQTYTELEIILVDDGSTDSSYSICKKWESTDTRIKVIHQSNKGAAVAKNTGLDFATGKLITFVDSDDYILPDMYLKLSEMMQKYNCDIMEAAYCQFTDDSEEGFVNHDITKPFIYTAKEAMKLHLQDKIFRQVVWNKMYTKDVIGNTKFLEGKYIDDEYWTYKVIGNAKRIGYLDTVFYCYRQHDKSAIGRVYNIKRLDAIDALEQRMNYIKHRFPELSGKAIEAYIGTCFYHYQCLCLYKELDHSHKERRKIINKIRNLSQKDFKLGMADVNLKYKMWYMLFKVFPDFICNLRNIFKIGL